MQWLPFITLCDWSRKHAPPSEPMKCNTSTIHDYHSRFPALYTSWKPIQAYSEIYLSLVSCLDYFDFVYTTHVDPSNLSQSQWLWRHLRRKWADQKLCFVQENSCEVKEGDDSFLWLAMFDMWLDRLSHQSQRTRLNTGLKTKPTLIRYQKYNWGQDLCQTRLGWVPQCLFASSSPIYPPSFSTPALVR